MPRVTVLMPSFNPPLDYARQCFAGLDAQTFRDFDALIIDESGPEIAAQINAMPTSFPKRVLRPDTRLGLARSLNLGVSSITSEFIARHDLDDICYPERLAKQIAYLDAHPDICAVSSWTMKIGPNSEQMGARKFPETPEQIYAAAGFWNPICHSAITMRRSFFDFYGEYDPGQKMEDHDLWMRAMAKGGRIVNLPEPLVRYRIETGFSMRRDWRGGFKVRWTNFTWDHLPQRFAGLALCAVAASAPTVVFDRIYWLFNRLR
jgi:glycosyltransferase involved in cell wall biosynthesis